MIYLLHGVQQVVFMLFWLLSTFLIVMVIAAPQTLGSREEFLHAERLCKIRKKYDYAEIIQMFEQRSYHVYYWLVGTKSNLVHYDLFWRGSRKLHKCAGFILRKGEGNTSKHHVQITMFQPIFIWKKVFGGKDCYWFLEGSTRKRFTKLNALGEMWSCRFPDTHHPYLKEVAHETTQ